jgi:hypothetical protein
MRSTTLKAIFLLTLLVISCRPAPQHPKLDRELLEEQLLRRVTLGADHLEPAVFQELLLFEGPIDSRIAAFDEALARAPFSSYCLDPEKAEIALEVSGELAHPGDKNSALFDAWLVVIEPVDNRVIDFRIVADSEVIENSGQRRFSLNSHLEHPGGLYRLGFRAYQRRPEMGGSFRLVQGNHLIAERGFHAFDVNYTSGLPIIFRTCVPGAS